MDKKRILDKVDQFVRAEIETYGVPALEIYELPYPIAEKLAKKLRADPFIIKLGVRLMDCKLSEALNMNRLHTHVDISVTAAEQILKDQGCSRQLIKQVLACVKEHHNTKFSSKEAEICANADCYKFLTLRGIMLYLHSLGKSHLPYDQALDRITKKIAEKWKILSLTTCKKELSAEYKKIMHIMKKAKLT